MTGVMTDYDPQSGMAFHAEIRRDRLREKRSELDWLVLRKEKCIAAFGTEKEANTFVGRRRLKVKSIRHA